MTLRQLEQLIVRFLCDRYNQSIDARMGDQTRFQRWEAGLPDVPDVIDGRHLDICLMKASRRTIQRGGYLQFENLMYRGEYLAGYAGETVSLRFDPTDITTILVYRQEDKREVFLARAHAQGLKTEQLSLEEAKASSRRLREAGKTLSNEAIFYNALEEDASLKKKSRKERQQEEQKLVRSQPEKAVEQMTLQPPEPQPEIVFDLGSADFTPIAFDELKGGW